MFDRLYRVLPPVLTLVGTILSLLGKRPWWTVLSVLCGGLVLGLVGREIRFKLETARMSDQLHQFVHKTRDAYNEVAAQVKSNKIQTQRDLFQNTRENVTGLCNLIEGAVTAACGGECIAKVFTISGPVAPNADEPELATPDNLDRFQTRVLGVSESGKNFDSRKEPIRSTMVDSLLTKRKSMVIVYNKNKKNSLVESGQALEDGNFTAPTKFHTAFLVVIGLKWRFTGRVGLPVRDDDAALVGFIQVEMRNALRARFFAGTIVAVLYLAADCLYQYLERVSYYNSALPPGGSGTALPGAKRAVSKNEQTREMKAEG